MHKNSATSSRSTTVLLPSHKIVWSQLVNYLSEKYPGEMACQKVLFCLEELFKIFLNGFFSSAAPHDFDDADSLRRFFAKGPDFISSHISTVEGFA